MNRGWLGWSGVAILLGLCLVIPTHAAEPPTEPLLRFETGMHTAMINRIATDREGRWAVTVSDDKTARVWEVASGRLLHVWRPPQGDGDEGKLFAAALSPDGTTMALGGWTQFNDGQNTVAPDGFSIYLVDRERGRLLHRIAGLPSVALHLAYSSDGRWLVSSLGDAGVRLFDATSGAEPGRDADYKGASYSAHFRADSRRLVTTSYDGQVRLYALEAGRLQLLKSTKLTGGERPYFARFSPDGRSLAVGFEDSAVVQVLDAETLAEVARPATTGVDNGNLGRVAWSADGRFLFASGSWDVGGKSPVRRWVVGRWMEFKDVPLAANTVMDLASLPDGGLLFAAGDPTWGVMSREGPVVRRQDSLLADFRDQCDALRLSADGRRVRFGYEYGGNSAATFDLSSRSLGADDPSLTAARTQAPGLTIESWEDTRTPRLNGQAVELKPYETSRSLAIAADGGHFALGTEWSLRFYDRTSQERWQIPVPGAAWAVNLSADGRYVVADYADGTIRWHRATDGKELLALFPHNDRQRWIAWTPEGYFDASPGAEDLIGYHLNRGRDQAGDFVPARQLWETFYQPGLIAHRLDADGDARVAQMVQQRGDIRQLLTVAPPVLELLSPAEGESDGTYRVKLRTTHLGQGTGRVVLRVDGQELAGRRQAPALTPGGVVEVSLELAEGAREVTAELIDGRGIGSKPVTARIQVRGPANADPATLHVLAVGVTNYRDRAMAQGVAFAAKDAQDVAAALERGGRGVYRQVRARVLPDAQATRDDIRNVGQEMALQVRPQDAFIIYFAGHGMSIDGDYYFLPWETRYTSYAALKEQGFSADMLRSLLRAIPASKVLVLLDTCSSGRFSLAPGRGLDDKASIDRLQRITGRALIAAAADEKMALEGEGGHGVFTHTVLRALAGEANSNRDGFVDVSELAAYVDQQLPEITKRKWNYEQFPVLETRGSSFPVTVGPNR
ncbi:MAG: caspase family protein [Nitrospira sp.]|nr:caspase family protein [Nitrospira sp.]